MLVLSAAVLVIVIDSRDVGLLVVPGARGFLAKTLSSQRGWRAGFNTKNTEVTKGFKEWFCARGWPRNDTDDHGRKVD